MELYGEGSSQVYNITTNNGANMISTACTLGWQRLLCFGHRLNLAVTNALKDD